MQLFAPVFTSVCASMHLVCCGCTVSLVPCATLACVCMCACGCACPSSLAVQYSYNRHKSAGMLREGAYGTFYQGQKPQAPGGRTGQGLRALEFTHVMIDEAGQVLLAWLLSPGTLACSAHEPPPPPLFIPSSPSSCCQAVLLLAILQIPSWLFPSMLLLLG